jgi:hypothetical protein
MLMHRKSRIWDQFLQHVLSLSAQDDLGVVYLSINLPPGPRKFFLPFLNYEYFIHAVALSCPYTVDVHTMTRDDSITDDGIN